MILVDLSEVLLGLGERGYSCVLREDLRGKEKEEEDCGKYESHRRVLFRCILEF